MRSPELDTSPESDAPPHSTSPLTVSPFERRMARRADDRLPLGAPVTAPPRPVVRDVLRSGVSALSRIARGVAAFARAAILAPAIEALLPADCPGCTRPLPGLSRGGLCARCWAGMEPVRSPLCPRCGIPFVQPFDGAGRDHLCGRCRTRPPTFDGARCALLYGGPVRAVVGMLKFERRSDLARPLGRMMLAALPSEEVFDVVVPVPLHWTRRAHRGYNQAALLSHRVARALGLPHGARILVKRRRTADQTRLDAAGRRENLRGSIVVRGGRLRRGPRASNRARSSSDGSRPRPSARRPLRGARVLLVDDVVTTGATAEICARALKRAGAARVFLLALARTPLPSGHAAPPELDRANGGDHPRSPEGR